MIRIYGLPHSRSFRAVWAAEEVDAAYVHVPVTQLEGGLGAPEYRALNPGGKVPTLVDGPLVLTESAAIVTWLADTHPAAGLAPTPGTPLRAQYLRWLFFTQTELEQPLWTIDKHTKVLPEELRVEAIVPTARWEFRQAERVLAEGLGDRPWILGDEFSGADIVILHCLSWARAQDLPTEHENLRAYVKRARQRPAYARARARQDAG
jgi:glutathione S-transferase